MHRAPGDINYRDGRNVSCHITALCRKTLEQADLIHTLPYVDQHHDMFVNVTGTGAEGVVEVD